MSDTKNIIIWCQEFVSKQNIQQAPNGVKGMSLSQQEFLLYLSNQGEFILYLSNCGNVDTTIY